MGQSSQTSLSFWVAKALFNPDGLITSLSLSSSFYSFSHLLISPSPAILSQIRRLTEREGEREREKGESPTCITTGWKRSCLTAGYTRRVSVSWGRERRAEFRTEEKQVYHQPLSQTPYLLLEKSSFTALLFGHLWLQMGLKGKQRLQKSRRWDDRVSERERERGQWLKFIVKNK